ncbi:hypothetical protein B7463_g2672, partial [Scytalidium lignicola]
MTTSVTSSTIIQKPTQQNLIACGIFRVVHRLSDTWVRKSPGVDDDFRNLQAIHSEATIYALLGEHCRIARCLSIGKTLDFVDLEFYPHGTLMSYIQTHKESISDTSRVRWALQIIEAVVFAHTKGIIHSDLALRQFFLDSDLNACLADFGASGYPGQEALGMEGASHFLPRDYDQPNTILSDLFALGSTPYELGAGKPPYQGCEDDVIENRFSKKDFPTVNGVLCGSIIMGCWSCIMESPKVLGNLEELRYYNQRVGLNFLEQSERFDRLDANTKDIVTALVNYNVSDAHGLQAQISALSTLLDRTEVVIKSQEDANRRIIVDIFQHLALTSSLHFSSITERYEAVDESHATTFDWIFRRPEDTIQYAEGRRWGNFNDWLKSGSGLYWINGKAGSGKSTLMKYIVSHRNACLLLKRWAGDSSLCTVSFFFWNSGSRLQRSQIGLFRSLLVEVLNQHPELIPIVLPAQWAARYSAKLRTSKFQQDGHVRQAQEPWELSNLQIAFKNFISQTSVPLKLCLFIDGLDEYEGNEEDLAEFFGNASMTENVKICCSSRPHQAFEDAFATRPGLRLQDLTFPDIRQYVHDKLENNTRMQRLGEQEPERPKELIEEIVAAANGELDDLFHQMIFKVDKVYQQETAQLFQLVGFAFRDQWIDELFQYAMPNLLPILLLSFATERDSTLALKARYGFMTQKDVISRCTIMEIHLRTRCGGLVEVQYGNQDPYKTTVGPEMKVGYLHRTVKDYLEFRETRKMLADRTGGQQKDAFSVSRALFKAHHLRLKAFDTANINKYLPWIQLRDTISWARRTEHDTRKGWPELLDEFYKVAYQLWSHAYSRGARKDFFQQQESMETPATQCGLYHYLDAKLSQVNAVTMTRLQRSLLDYALTPAEETEGYISPEVLTLLLERGANPNKNETNSKTSPWQNALLRLDVTVSTMSWDAPERPSAFLDRWAPIIKMLLKYGANPDIQVSGPRKYGTMRRKEASKSTQLTPDELILRIFATDPGLVAELRAALKQAKLKWSQMKSSERKRSQSLVLQEELEISQTNQDKSCMCCLVQ